MSITQTNAKYPAPIIFGAIGDALDRDMLVREAWWTGCDTAGDALIISDYDSTAILFQTVGFANMSLPIECLRGQLIDGLKVTDMSSGQLLIYL